MPTNAVERLKKIEDDINSVLSIYDVAEKSCGENENKKKNWGNSDERKTLPEKLSGSSKMFNKSLKKLDYGAFIGDDFKKFGSCTLNPTLDKQPESLTTYHNNKKPSSAPSSYRICKSDIYQSLAFETSIAMLKKPIPSKTRTVNDINASLHNWGLFINPDKTVETPEVIMSINNYQSGEESNQHSLDRSIRLLGNEPRNSQQGKEIGSLKTNSTSNIEKITDKEIYNKGTKYIIRARSESPRKSIKMEKFPQYNPLISKSLAFTKTQLVEAKKEKFPLEILPTQHMIPKKITRIKKQSSLDFENINRNKGEKSTNWFYDEKELEIQTKGRAIKQGMGGFDEDSKTDAKAKHLVKDTFRKKQIDEDHKNIEDEILKKMTNKKAFQNKRISKAGTDDPDLGANELFEVIERSNEKLKKMKASKELALDIAKTLKDQYEGVQQSKQDMIKILQKVKKNNDRLGKQIKNVNESKIKLQLQMEELRKDSKTKILEKDIKNNELKEENVWLKTKINELRKHHNKKLFEKESQRFENNEKIRKQRTELTQAEEDVKRLTNEKISLLAKVHQLRSALNDRQLTIGIHELKICELQEQVQKEKLHLKQKSDALEETNNELELIRQSSKYLEEQVKTLRKNIENFDELHENLVQKTFDYEHQIKSNQEEVRKLQNENDKLKKELDNEKDSLLIKNKIIEDQQETIKQLREKSEEVKAMMKRNQSLERVLNIEREEKLELQEAVERLKQRKEELKEKIKSLEDDLLVAPQEVVRDLQKTQVVLYELENQVQIKQREWELHLQTIAKEKERACSVAEFATKKLVQKTSEFQKQSEELKKLHRVLTENLAEKEEHLREANKKVIV